MLSMLIGAIDVGIFLSIVGVLAVGRLIVRIEFSFCGVELECLMIELLVLELNGVIWLARGIVVDQVWPGLPI